MTSAPNNKIFKEMFANAKRDNNLEVLKELKEIGELAMGWGKRAVFYKQDVNTIHRVSTIGPEYIAVSYCRNDAPYLNLSYSETDSVICCIDDTCYGYAMNENGVMTGKRFSRAGWEAFIALFEEWANNGSIETVRG